jgi:hypothetical protein
MGPVKIHRRMGYTDACKLPRLEYFPGLPNGDSEGKDRRAECIKLIHSNLQVIHNELDYRLPISEGLAMFNVLQAREIPSRFVMFPDENHVCFIIFPVSHSSLASLPQCLPSQSPRRTRYLTNSQWVIKPENSLVWHREVLDWINKYSGIADKAATSSRIQSTLT